MEHPQNLEEMHRATSNIAIENGHLYWVFPLQVVIFHSNVILPEDGMV